MQVVLNLPRKWKWVQHGGQMMTLHISQPPRRGPTLYGYMTVIQVF